MFLGISLRNMLKLSILQNFRRLIWWHVVNFSAQCFQVELWPTNEGYSFFWFVSIQVTPPLSKHHCLVLTHKLAKLGTWFKPARIPYLVPRKAFPEGDVRGQMRSLKLPKSRFTLQAIHQLHLWTHARRRSQKPALIPMPSTYILGCDSFLRKFATPGGWAGCYAGSQGVGVPLARRP